MAKISICIQLNLIYKLAIEGYMMLNQLEEDPPVAVVGFGNGQFLKKIIH